MQITETSVASACCILINGITDASQSDHEFLQRFCSQVAQEIARSGDTLQAARADAANSGFADEELKVVLRTISSYDDLCSVCEDTTSRLFDRITDFLGHWSGRLMIEQHAA